LLSTRTEIALFVQAGEPEPESPLPWIEDDDSLDEILDRVLTLLTPPNSKADEPEPNDFAEPSAPYP
jgi:hypothetical protein